MFWFSQNRDFLRQMFKLALPIAAQNLIWSSLSFVDNIIVAGLGSRPLAVVTLINQYYFIFYLVQFGVTSGASIFAAQFWGNKDIPNIKRVLGITLATMTACSIMFFIPVIIFPDLILGIFTDDKNLISEGRTFLQILGFSNIFLAVSASFMFIQRSIGNVKLPLIISSISLLINTLLNYVLIYGLFSMPKLGLTGSALATLISRLIEITLVLVLIYAMKNPIACKYQEYFNIKSDFIKSFFKTTAPVIFNELVWSTGISMYYVVYGRMGTETIASMSITSTFEKIFFTLFIGLGSACGIIIGHKIGERNEKEAYDVAKRYLKVAVLCGILTGISLIATSNLMLKMFHVNTTITNLTLFNIYIFSVFCVFKGLNFIGFCGILRSGGDTRYSFLIETICLWFIGVPLAFISGMIFKAPVYIVYLVVSVEEIIKLVFMLKRVNSRKWINNLTTMPPTLKDVADKAIS